MPKNITFGALLRLAAEAYELKTGNEFRYSPAYLYETYANVEAWKGDKT